MPVFKRIVHYLGLGLGITDEWLNRETDTHLNVVIMTSLNEDPSDRMVVY